MQAYAHHDPNTFARCVMLPKSPESWSRQCGHGGDVGGPMRDSPITPSAMRGADVPVTMICDDVIALR